VARTKGGAVMFDKSPFMAAMDYILSIPHANVTLLQGVSGIGG
jgi:hypothetical protein